MLRPPSALHKRSHHSIRAFKRPGAIVSFALSVIILGTLAGCSSIRALPGAKLVNGLFRGPVKALPKGGGRRFTGTPYWKLGHYFVPRADPGYDKIGIASHVSLTLHGNRTANGELEDTTALVAAHPTLPLPSIAEVTNLSNGCRIFLRLNDRGPFVPGRIIDMSPAAAKLLGFHNEGLTRVRLRYWQPAPLDGDDSFEQQYLIRYPDLGCRKPRTG